MKIFFRMTLLICSVLFFSCARKPDSTSTYGRVIGLEAEIQLLKQLVVKQTQVCAKTEELIQKYENDRQATHYLLNQLHDHHRGKRSTR